METFDTGTEIRPTPVLPMKLAIGQIDRVQAHGYPVRLYFLS